MKYIGDINYISATEDEITRQILFGNALFEAGGMEELFSEQRSKDLILSAVSIITPTQTVSLPFDYSTSDGGHAGITDAMLSRIYPGYERGRQMDQEIYFEQGENNIFILYNQGDPGIVIFEPEEMTQKQYNELSRYIEKLKQSDSVKKGILEVVCFKEDVVPINQIDVKMTEFRSRIIEKDTPREYVISKFDLSDCKSEEEIMEHARIYSEKFMQEMKKTGENSNGVPKEGAHANLIIEHLLKLKDSRDASNEQLNKIAKSYGINLDGTRIKRPLLSEEELDLEER